MPVVEVVIWLAAVPLAGFLIVAAWLVAPLLYDWIQRRGWPNVAQTLAQTDAEHGQGPLSVLESGP
jgi:hypothetical protein